MNMNDYINPQDYPELYKIMWDRRHLSQITLLEALKMYEYRWEYVFPENMTNEERDFLNMLIKTVGNGNFYT